MKNKNLFIGILVIFTGTIFLLNSLEIIDLQLSTAVKLWPLILTITGISLLPINDYLKGFFLLIALGIGCLLYKDEYESRHKEKEFQNILDDNDENIKKAWDWGKSIYYWGKSHSDDI